MHWGFNKACSRVLRLDDNRRDLLNLTALNTPFNLLSTEQSIWILMIPMVLELQAETGARHTERGLTIVLVLVQKTFVEFDCEFTWTSALSSITMNGRKTLASVSWIGLDTHSRGRDSLPDIIAHLDGPRANFQSYEVPSPPLERSHSFSARESSICRIFVSLSRSYKLP